MAAKRDGNQIAFRYRSTDSRAGVTRRTAKRLAAALGVDETQAIHMALREMAVRVLPQYRAEGSTPATEAVFTHALNWGSYVLFGLWTLIFIIGYLGAAKPF